MMAMLRTNAILRPSSAGRRETPNAGGSTSLPSATNIRIAAMVAQLVIRWLLAIRIALLRAPCTSAHTPVGCEPPQISNICEDYATVAGTDGRLIAGGIVLLHLGNIPGTIQRLGV